MSNTPKTSKFALLSVMLCFFTMGFVDLVGIASNYVQQDLGLTHAQANIMPSLVFFWFLIFSVPTGMLMNKIGRKKTVLLSILVTVLSLILPLCGESYAMMLCAFSLLGIGNALMQTSLNPLVSNIVTGNLSSTLTFGQFVKAIASFLAPYIAMWGATAAIPHMGLGWKVLFPIYAIVGIVAILALSFTSIHEEPVAKGSSFVDCFKLLGKPFILLCFLGQGNDPDALQECIDYVYYHGLKTCLYSGVDSAGDLPGLMHLTYIKVGHYDEALGGLDKPTTNQRMYAVTYLKSRDGRHWYAIDDDITYKFWRKKE